MAVVNLLRWWREVVAPPEKSVTAWAQIAALPDPPEMFYPDGRNKRARVSRYPEPDKARLSLDRPTLKVVRQKVTL